MRFRQLAHVNFHTAVTSGMRAAVHGGGDAEERRPRLQQTMEFYRKVSQAWTAMKREHARQFCGRGNGVELQRFDCLRSRDELHQPTRLRIKPFSLRCIPPLKACPLAKRQIFFRQVIRALVGCSRSVEGKELSNFQLNRFTRIFAYSCDSEVDQVFAADPRTVKCWFQRC